MSDTIFTKIIKGELPAYKVYEDSQTLAFLDIHPRAEGHTLVIPKAVAEAVWGLEDKDYENLMRVTKVVARRLKSVLGTNYVAMQVVGVDVPHAHVHLLPFNDVAEWHNMSSGKSKIDAKNLAELSERLRFAAREDN